MRTIRLIAVGFMVTFVFTLTALAQAQPPVKIALVNTDAFYAEEGGITKILNAYKSLEVEFKSTQQELQTMGNRINSLRTELQALQTRANDPENKVPIDRASAQSKAEELERLERDFKFKKEDAEVRYSRREAAVLGPIIQDVGNQLGKYAEQKGYTMVFDVGKLVNAQAILYWQENTEITKEFVQFYNTRPAGTATARPQ